MRQAAITVDRISKKYRIGHRKERYRTLRDSLGGIALAPIRRLRSFGQASHREADEIWALRNVSFEVQQGEVLGVVGPNGSGKSTLLKILSRITKPTEGRAEIRGRVGSLLEVGTGFHLELTGRENVYLSGNILGMKKAEINRRFDEIVAFSGVEQFIDTPVKRYSSGMRVRLGFAVAAHLEPEVLLVDEVLAVGDAAFQKKCLGKMERAAAGGRTVLFVSHNMGAVKSLCTKAVVLEQGALRVHGSVDQAVDAYMAQSTGVPMTQVAFAENGELDIQLLRAELVPNESGGDRGQTNLMCTYIVRREPPDDVLLCVDIRNRADVSVFYSNDSFLVGNNKRNVGEHTVAVSIPTHLLAPGEYIVALGFWEPGHAPVHFPDARLTFRRADLDTGISAHGIAWPSVIYLPAVWTYVQYEGAVWEGENG